MYQDRGFNRGTKVSDKCRLCGKEKSKASMLSHVRAKHPLEFDDYFKSRAFINYIPSKSKVKPFTQLNTSEVVQVYRGLA